MYIARTNQTVIEKSLASPYISVILGPRRVGKSTLLKHQAVLHPQRDWVFLNMDSLEARSRVEAGQLRQLVQEHLKRTLDGQKKTWLVIDEAQKCPALFEQVKMLYDQYKDQEVIKIILTGSSFLELHLQTAESLAGRVVLNHLREFTLAETLSLTFPSHTGDNASIFKYAFDDWDQDKLKQFILNCAPLRNERMAGIDTQCIWGGLPEALLESEQSVRRLYLGNYLQTYLEKDIRAIGTIHDLPMYQKLLELFAEQTGSIRQDTSVTEALGCARDTLKKYRGYLLATLVYQEIYPFIGSSLKRLVKSPKGYLTNNGLISYLTGLDELKALQKTGLIGHRFENFILKELRVWLDQDTKKSEIYYWRTSTGVEVDFVIEKKPEIFPIEITYSSQIQAKKIKNLCAFLQEEPKAKRAYYFYLGDFHYDDKRKICFLPAWAL